MGRVGYGSFHNKINLQTDFEGNKFLQGNTWGKKFPRLKKKSFMAYNPGKILHRGMSGKKIPSPEDWRKKNSYPNQITHTHLKSQMVVPLVRFSRLVR